MHALRCSFGEHSSLEHHQSVLQLNEEMHKQGHLRDSAPTDAPKNNCRKLAFTRLQVL